MEAHLLAGKPVLGLVIERRGTTVLRVRIHVLGEGNGEDLLDNFRDPAAIDPPF